MKQLLVLLEDDERGSAVVRDDRVGSRKSDLVPQSIRYGEAPSAARTIAIVPAARMRTLVIALPPTPPEKRLAVVRYALEDQLAGDVDAQHVVIAAYRDGRAVVHAVDRAWLNAVVERMDAGGNRPNAIVAESDLAPAALDAVTWIWSEDGGFLVAPDGRISILDRSEETLPSGLLLALRAEPAPAQVVVRGPDALANAVRAWSQATGVPFTLEAPWRWNEASDEALAGAPNLMTPELGSPSARAPRRAVVRWGYRALGWAGAALALHTLATIVDWGVLRVQASRIERETKAQIDATLPAANGDLAAWRRAVAAARHAQGRTAPDDALPLLADAAAGLSELPPGAIRVINFEAGQLTLDFDKAAAAALEHARPAWAARGISALSAETAGALRVRLARE